MSVTSLGFIATAFTAACLVAVAASDPNRAAGKPSSSRKLRPLAAIAAILPGVVFLFMGSGVALLIWLGSSAMLGWMIAVVFSSFLSEKKSRVDQR